MINSDQRPIFGTLAIKKVWKGGNLQLFKRKESTLINK